jgi:protein-S-isoprenylcysteine O-methyltransferase Ste14
MDVSMRSLSLLALSSLILLAVAYKIIKKCYGEALKVKDVIDFYKATSPVVVLLIMLWNHQESDITCCVYLSMQAAYGLLWCTKSQYYGDHAWDKPFENFAAFIVCNVVLMANYSYILALSLHSYQWHPLFLSLCIFIFTIGIFLHFVSDMQKQTQLKAKPKLIVDGMFTHSRNPNYLGELCIYGAFNMLAFNAISLLLFGLLFYVVWWPRMIAKDVSISRYAGFDKYAGSSGFLFPKKLF